MRQLDLLAQSARTYGWAVGIGHDNAVTLRILKDYMSSLEAKGFRFVLVSELAH
jgi:polysaccharide deacetylase 2 family uncharacterized protein YibQ